MKAKDWALLPPTEFQSAFTLTQKNSIGTNFNSGTSRFPQYVQGSFFAETNAVTSSFQPNNKFHKPKEVSPDDIPKGRPLWLSELRKEVPPGANYDLDAAIGSKKLIHKTRGAVIPNTFDKYQRTCDI